MFRLYKFLTRKISTRWKPVSILSRNCRIIAADNAIRRASNSKTFLQRQPKRSMLLRNVNKRNYWSSVKNQSGKAQRSVVNQEYVQRRYEQQNHDPTIKTRPHLNSNPASASTSNPVVSSVGSKSNPVYMKKQTSIKEFVLSLFPFVFIFWILGGFEWLRNRKQQNGVDGMDGMDELFDDANFSEWDEENWEDEQDEQDDATEHEARPPLLKEEPAVPDRDRDRRTQFFHKLGIWLSLKKEEPAKVEAKAKGKAKAKPKKKRRRVRFRDVCGNEEAKIDLADLVDYLKYPRRYREMGCKLPKGVLMTGPPGTGKTLLARALAGEAGVPFLATNGASFDEIYVGVGVKRVRKLFERAKELSPCIVFIDEIDAIGSTRVSVGSAHSSDSLNALLSELDGFEQNSGVIVIAATNMMDRLDHALVRPGRFDRKVYLNLPGKKAREDIVQLYLKGRQDDTVDMELLVSDIAGFSGAQLESMVNLASIEAVKQSRKQVSMNDLIEAKEIISMGRARRSLEIPQATLECTAYHESGHAIVSLYTRGAKPIYKATILPRGKALGFVASTNSDEFMVTKQALLAQLDVSMAGRAAEEMVNGSKLVTTGASSDFNKATNIATAMVCQFGMSNKIGKMFHNIEDIPSLSVELQNDINTEVRRLLNESFYRAQSLLREHQQDLLLLANELMKKETLNGDEIRVLLNWDESKQKEPLDSISMLPDFKHKQTEIEWQIRNSAAGSESNKKITPKKKNSSVADILVTKGGMLRLETELLDPIRINKL